MKKNIVWLIIVCTLVISMLVLACTGAPAPTAPASQPASGASRPASAPAAAPVKIRYSTALEPGHHNTSEMQWFAKELNTRTNGRVTVEVYPSAQLYDSGTVVDAVANGAIEMGYIFPARYAGRDPIYGFYSYFFMFENTQHLDRAKAKIGGILYPMFEKYNVKSLHWFGYGDSGLLTTKRQVILPQDMKGMSIEAATKEQLEGLKAMGAVPASIATAEVYDALAKGAIDGNQTGWSTFVSRKQYEVARYAMGPISVGVGVAQINLDFWNKLDKDLQKTIMDLSNETEVLSFKNATTADQQYLDTLKKNLTAVTILTPEQASVWRTAAAAPIEAWAQSCEKTSAASGAGARAIIKACQDTKG